MDKHALYDPRATGGRRRHRLDGERYRREPSRSSAATADPRLDIRDQRPGVLGCLAVPACRCLHGHGRWELGIALLSVAFEDRPVQCGPKPDVRITGTLTNSGQASVCYDALQGCQSQFIFQGYTLPPSAAAGNAVPIRIGVGDASGSPATGLAPLLYLAPVQAGIVGTFVPATSVGKANQGNMFRKIAPGQYMYNLDTKSLTPGTWVLRTRLPDGGTYTSSFVVQ
jgi:hypothetical protein